LRRSPTTRARCHHDARLRLVSSADGTVIHHGRAVLRRIVEQVSAPVRWDLCMRTLGELGVTGVIEVPPAGTLTGLINARCPGVETLALKTPDDLDTARRSWTSARGQPAGGLADLAADRRPVPARSG
jgi:[acyl-carrier-protein] S-malonyltransferase